VERINGASPVIAGFPRQFSYFFSSSHFGGLDWSRDPDPVQPLIPKIGRQRKTIVKEAPDD
jgi:hypothetical protein